MSEESNKPRGFGARITESVRSFGASAYRAVKKRINGPKERFVGGRAPVEVQFDPAGGTVWATQQQMADLFGVNVPAISKHVSNIYAEGELTREATLSILETVRPEGGRQVTRDIEHYSLEMVFAVGYRVSGPLAIQFRAWATDKLTAFVRDGFVLNEQRLRNDPDALQSLAEKVRALRADEKHVFARVRDAFMLTASDYDPSSDEARRFFTTLQEKFTYAAAECTSAELILARADGSKEMMGMSSFLGPKLTKKDTTVGKNYLLEQELRYLHLVSEAFLVFLEGKAMKGKQLTMAELIIKMDKILEFNEMPIFPGYKSAYLRDKADAHAHREYDLFKARNTQAKYDAARRIPPV